jgi:hypothetical protein
MANIVVLDRKRHAGKGWRHPVGYSFASTEAAVALVASEFARAALALPIAFVEHADFFVPVMLTSPMPSRNAAVGPAGQWFVGYVPAVLRAYPFSLRTSAKQEILCVDEDSGLIVDEDHTTEKLFEADGSISPSVSSVLQLLRHLDQNRIATNQAVVALSDAGVIRQWPLVVPVGDQQIPVDGLYCVDEVAVNALDDAALVEIRRALGMAYAQILSMGQVDVLSRLASVQEKASQIFGRMSQAQNTQ